MPEETQAERPERARPNVKMVDSPTPVDEFYIDGASGLISRGGVIKLDLFRVVGFDPDTKVEMRQVSHRLVLPLTALPDLLKAFQSVARAAQQAAQETSSKAESDSEGSASPVSNLVEF